MNDNGNQSENLQQQLDQARQEIQNLKISQAGMAAGVFNPNALPAELSGQATTCAETGNVVVDLGDGQPVEITQALDQMKNDHSLQRYNLFKENVDPAIGGTATGPSKPVGEMSFDEYVRHTRGNNAT